MTEKQTGGCACGAIRYEAVGTPIVQNHCQCLDCQKRSGTGHSSYLVVEPQETVSIRGAPRRYCLVGDSGNEKTHAFCGTCGTPIFVTFAAMPHLIAFHAGSLDKPENFAPTLVTYHSRALPWDQTPSELQEFGLMPPTA